MNGVKDYQVKGEADRTTDAELERPTVRLDTASGCRIRPGGNIKYSRDTVWACAGAALNMLGTRHTARSRDGQDVWVIKVMPDNQADLLAFTGQQLDDSGRLVIDELTQQVDAGIGDFIIKDGGSWSVLCARRFWESYTITDCAAYLIKLLIGLDGVFEQICADERHEMERKTMAKECKVCHETKSSILFHPCCDVCDACGRT